MNEDDFSRLPPAAQAYIRELETRNRQLGERITQLEEQFRLAQNKRFAPSSEKLKDRVFDEAEQVASTEHDDTDADDMEDAFVLPDTGLPETPAPTRSKPGRKPLPAHLPRQRMRHTVQGRAVDIFARSDGGDHRRTGIAARQRLGRHRCGDDRRALGVALAVAACILEAHVLKHRGLYFDMQLFADLFAHTVQGVRAARTYLRAFGQIVFDALAWQVRR